MNKKKKILLYISLLIIILILFMLYARFIGTKGIIVKEYKIETTIPDNFDGLKIVHISDIHYGGTFKEKELKKLVKNVNLINPDIIVITGDIFEKDIFDDNANNILTANLKEMNAKLGKYAITGNHDLNHNEFNDILNNSNFINIDNTYELIYYNDQEPIIIAGISSSYDNIAIETKLNNYKKYIEKNDIKYKILLLHEPDIIENITDNFNLILAGHSHNGQIKLPLIGPLLLKEGSKRYYKEHYTINNQELYISSGLGTSTLPLRFQNHPSINFYRINNK